MQKSSVWILGEPPVRTELKLKNDVLFCIKRGKSTEQNAKISKSSVQKVGDSFLPAEQNAKMKNSSVHGRRNAS